MLQVPSSFPVLVTERLTLRQPTLNDAQEIYLLRSNTEVNKYLNRKPCENLAEAETFIKNVNKNYSNKQALYWAITLSAENKLIGTICLFDFSTTINECEIGYELLPHYQGMGIMHEAAKKVIEFAFQTLKLHALNAYTLLNNTNSTQLLQKLNFKKNMGNLGTDALITFSLSANDFINHQKNTIL